MNKQLFFCLLLAMAVTVKAQVWSPPGATWMYSYTNNFAITGYVEIKYVGDSMVGGQMTKVLEKIRYTLDQFTGTNDTINLGNEYTYSDSNIVYYYRFGQFFKLYDFNAQVNEQWIIAGESTGCDSTGKVQVDSVNSLVINSNTLISLRISSPDSSEWVLGSSLVERIGCTDGYMFPEPDTCMIDYNEGGPFRCYWDDSFPVYSSGITTTCDFITSIKQINIDMEWSVYPNPNNGEFIIRIEMNKPEDLELKVTNIVGKLIYNEKFTGISGNYQNVIDLSSYAKGIYTFELKAKEGTVNKKIVVQ